MHGRSLANSLACFKMANTASYVAALMVAEGSVLDNRPSGYGKLSNTDFNIDKGPLEH